MNRFFTIYVKFLSHVLANLEIPLNSLLINLEIPLNTLLINLEIPLNTLLINLEILHLRIYLTYLAY